MVASNCPENQEDLVPLAYGRLDAERRSELEKHLSDCPACRQEVAGLKAVRGALAESSLPNIRLPREDDFVERVMTTVQLRPVPARKPSTKRLPRRSILWVRPMVDRLWFRLLLSGAAAALLVGFGWWVLSARDAGKGEPPAGVQKAPVIATAPPVEEGIEQRIEKQLVQLLDQAQRAASPDQLRALCEPLARAADLEAARPNVCLERWSYLTLAESLAGSADRAAYRPVLIGVLKLAAEGGSSSQSGGVSGDSPALQTVRGLLAAGKTSEAGSHLAGLPTDVPASPVIAGRVLSRRIRAELAAGPLTGQAWDHLRDPGTLNFVAKDKGLVSDLAGVVRGDLAAAALDYDRALAEWRAAGDRLAAGRPELAASLALRAACVTLLPRGQARDAADLLKRLDERHGGSAAAALCRRELSGIFADEALAEAGRNKAFLAAMGIPFDLRRQVLTPLGTSPGLDSESIPISNYDLKDMVQLLQFLQPLPLAAAGRGTVVTGHIRLSACSAEKPMEVLVCAQAGNGRIAVARVEPPLPGMTYHMRVVVWEAAAVGLPPGLQVSLRPEGQPTEPAKLSGRTGVPPQAARRGAGQCVVQCVGKNVGMLELSNFKLDTDVDLTAPVPW